MANHQKDDWHTVHEQLQVVQKKSMTVNSPEDSDETEADEVARKVVAGESTSATGVASGINRKGQGRVEASTGFQNQLQNKKGTGSAEASPEFQSQLQNKKGSGDSLDDSVRAEMESKMGSDFSNVRIHTGSEAGSMSQSINAKAFTHGQDVYFNQGQYNPSSSQGKELLAHELVHTIQQSGEKVQPKIQRRILINGNPYTPTAKNASTTEQEDYERFDERLLNQLHNDGLPPDYNFPTQQEFEHNMSMRTSAMKTMLSLLGETNTSASFGEAGYNDAGEVEFSLPPTWFRYSRLEYHMTVGDVDGKPNTPSRAVRSIFENGKGQTKLDCNMMIIATQYKALLDTYKDEKFDLMFPGGTNLIIGQNKFDDPKTPKKEGYASTPSGAHPLYDLGLFTRTEVNPADDILSQLVPGDWIYFKNAPEYMQFILAYEQEVRNHLSDYYWPQYGRLGEWQGEHAVYLGNNLFDIKKENRPAESEPNKINEFAGFGLNTRLNYDDMVSMMIDACRFEYKLWKRAEKGNFTPINSYEDVPTSVVAGKPGISTIYKMNVDAMDKLAK